MVPIINELLNNKKYKDVALYISALRLHSLFDVPSMISKFVNQDKIQEAFLLAEEDQNYKFVFISMYPFNHL